MTTRPYLLLLLSTVSLFGVRSVWAQPVTVVGPDGAVRIARNQPSWDDNNSHFRLRLAYDGRRIRLLNATVGAGSARSYLSQRSDVVVVVLNVDGKAIRVFNLPDPLEVRAWDRNTAIRPRRDLPVTDLPGTGPIGAVPRIRDLAVVEPQEHTLHKQSTQFDLFVPQLPGAQRLELHRGAASGPLLGRVDLTAIR
jgi:hypothetical protein